MERNLWVRRPPTVQTARITSAVPQKTRPGNKKDVEITMNIRRKNQNQAMKENMGMLLKGQTQRTLHQKNKLKVYCKIELLLFCATAH